MAISITNAASIVVTNALVDLVDAGSADANGDIKIYDGTVPTDADTALSGNTLLATVEAPIPAFGGASDSTPGATATLLGVPLSDLAIDATGTATFFRINDRDNANVIQGSVGTSGTDMIVNTTAFVALATFTITALTVFHPES